MKKALGIIRTIIVWTVVLISVSMMIFTVISVTTLNKNNRTLFGYKMYIVNSDSMKATDFKAGDLIFVKEVDPSTLKKGDIITFVSQDINSLGETLTHKIRLITTDSKGNPGFVTYGTTTDVNDESIVRYGDVLGKYEWHIPKIGGIFNFLKTVPGYFICIFTPIMLIIIYEGVNFFSLLRKNKEMKMNEIQLEKEKLEAERVANEKLLEELRILKAQLEEQQRVSSGERKVCASDKTEDL